MHKLTFTLTQHTPIIHFQHDQDGATLRATEVKPKLDKFLIEKEGGIKECRRKHPDWFISEKHDALNYKLKIESTKGRDCSIINDSPDKRTGKYSSKPYPLILANMGGKDTADELRDMVFYGQNNCAIFCLNDGLRRIIKEEGLVHFFCSTGFGNRTTKGFGVYTVQKIDDVDEEYLDASIKYLNENSILSIEADTKDYDGVFVVIDYIWKLIKSGVNYSKCERGTLSTQGYFKSFLYQYLDNKAKQKSSKITWEKKWVKEKFMGLGTPNDNDKTPKFARAILGLSDKFEFKGKVKDCNTEYSGQAPFHDFTINIKSDEIERIMSPIIFRPILTKNKFRIYVTTSSNINLDIFDKDFTFSLSEIKDFRLQIGFDKVKNIPINKFIRRNTAFDSIDKENIEKARFQASENEKLKYQVERLKEYCEMTQHFHTIPDEVILKTPTKDIVDLKDLIVQFSTRYASIVARDFSGQQIIKCELKLLSNV